MLWQESACTWSEIEAKASERIWNDLPRSIDPPHLTVAKRRLAGAGFIKETKSKTRGGREIGIWHHTNLGERQRRYEKAAARKRLLHARFLGWASGTPKSPGIIGPAAERAVHSSLLKAAGPAGFAPANRRGGPITHFLGERVPGGPLDNLIFLVRTDDRGIPSRISSPIEVKSLRDWISPNSADLHQLLDKCARLQVLYPEELMAPLLICRRRTFNTWAMGRELGFFCFEMKAQFVPPLSDVTEEKVEEIRAELGFRDLQIVEKGDEQPLPLLVDQLTEKLTKAAPEATQRWAAYAPKLQDFFTALRDKTTSGVRRDRLMVELREDVSRLPGCRVKW